MSSKYMIYGLVDPRDGHLRYIGRSSSGLQRPRQHGRTWALKNCCTYKSKWILKLQSLGLQYGVVVIQEYDSPDLLNEYEIFWISYFRSLGCPLTNVTLGGGGVCGFKHSEQSRKVMSESRKRYFTDPNNKASNKASQRVRWDKKESHIQASKSHGGTAIVDQNGIIYETQHEAARILGLHVGNINAVLCGRRRHTRGYIFTRVRD